MYCRRKSKFCNRYEHDEIGDKIFLEMSECLDQAIDAANLEINSGYVFFKNQIHVLFWIPDFILLPAFLPG